MSEEKRSPLKLLPTGVPGLDEVLGGGLPEFSFNLLAGAPGAGKTTLVHQFVFANATKERPALFFTVLGEPALKMLRYQQQMAFFDADKLGDALRFVDLSEEVIDRDLSKVLDTIVRHVQEVKPAVVVVDSFRTVVRSKSGDTDQEAVLQDFVQRLALHLANWQITSFLIGEYIEAEMQNNPVFTIADGILWLSQIRDRSSVVRKLQVMKMRGACPAPGLHTFRISGRGIQVFARTQGLFGAAKRALPSERRETGIRGLDELLGGGIPAGDLTLVAGPSGTGKTVIGTQFVSAGCERGERAVIAIFEEHPDDYLARGKSLGFDLEAMAGRGDLEVIYLRPLDLSPDEIVRELQQAVTRIGATRLVIDSLNGVELSIASSFRDEFRESLYRMVGGLSASGVTILMTIEVAESFTGINFSPHAVSFLSQNIIYLRYVELESRLQRLVNVVKMRRSAHSRDMCAYEITGKGMVVHGPMREFEGLLTGVARRRPRLPRPGTVGLEADEAAMLAAIVAQGGATAAALATAAGQDPAEAARILGRLQELGHVVRSGEGAQAVYRVTVLPLGK